MKRIITMLLVGFLSANALGKASAEGCSRQVGEDQRVSTCERVSYEVDRASRTIREKGVVASSDDPTGTKYVYSIVAACDASVNAGGGNSACANFGNCPPRTAPDGAPMRADRMRGLRALRGPGGQP